MQDQATRHHEDLQVWKCGIAVAKQVYQHSAGLPASEQFGLTGQLRRAAVSIPANIAEGAARGSSREFARFISIAQGSLAELETHLILVRELYDLQCDAALGQNIISLRRMLIRLRASLVARERIKGKA